MSTLIPLQSGRYPVNARDLHAFLLLGRDFSTWAKEQLAGFVAGEDFSPFSGKSTGGRPTVEYALTFDTAKHLSMLARNERGKQIRQWFIEREKTLANVETRFQLPQTFADALRLAADLEEERLALTAKVGELTPKADGFDALVGADGNYKVAEAAKILGTVEKRLYALLRDLGILRENNEPYQQHIDCGRFLVRTGTFGTDTKRRAYRVTLVTPKGLTWLREIIKPHAERLGIKGAA